MDDGFAYVIIGGTVADQNEGTNGLRKVALDSGTVTMLDDGAKNSPQSENGGIDADENYIHWNAGGNILRILKNGGQPEAIVSDQVGIGIDMTVDDEKIYWANHGYYAASSPAKPKPIYMVSKKGGKAEVFVQDQDSPGHIVADKKYVYWHTVNGIYKKLKSGGKIETIFQKKDIGIDVLVQDGASLYYGFRDAGESRWALCRISKVGGDQQTLVKTFSLSQFVVNPNDVYFFDEDNSHPHAICKVPKNGGEVTRLDAGYASGSIAQDNGSIYFSGPDDIYSIAK